jgi:hypothetical protein
MLAAVAREMSMHPLKSAPLIAGLVVLATMLAAPLAQAMPAFARQYELSCSTCHAAFPRLNAFGETFRDQMNLRMPDWRPKTTLPIQDDELALPKSLPLAVRMQANVQSRSAEEVDPLTGPTGNSANTDFQTPYLIKLLSGAPLSDHITYYFYGIFAEKGANGTTIIEDAWFRHDDLFGTKVAGQLGQFQISDLMFPRETRMTFQDFMAYRMAGITYDRGVLFTRALGPVDTALGLVNGNGIEQNFTINSPGIRRPDAMFDNDASKTAFGRVGMNFAGMKAGLFGLAGRQKNATGAAAIDTGTRDTNKRILGIDASGNPGGKVFWFGQVLWNRWNGFLEPDKDYRWTGGFAGIDYVPGGRWVYSVLWNQVSAGDFADSGTVYEGLAMRTLTVGASYYFMRNVKGLVEVNVDLLDKKARDAAPFVGHLTKEHYLLFGLDAAF